MCFALCIIELWCTWEVWGAFKKLNGAALGCTSLVLSKLLQGIITWRRMLKHESIVKRWWKLISGFYIQLSFELCFFFQGSGFVVVTDATEWEYETHMRHAKDRVVCVTYTYLLGILWAHVVLSVTIRFNNQALVILKVDNAIHRIDHYPVGSAVCYVNTYPTG